MTSRLPVALLSLACVLGVVVRPAGAAEDYPPGATIEIHRAAGAVTVDGDLSDPGWQGATRVETWYETNPGDNLEPKVKSVGLLTYDEKFFYAGFEFSDPDPKAIRAPLGDRDNVPSYTDYGGVLLDTSNDGKTGILLVANPRGVQYDSVNDDISGNEDSSPDFYWDVSTRITATGWVLEMRVPFSTLRYGNADPQTWGILLYRNYPRAFRYQMFSAKLPRGRNCFVCNENKLTGLTGLPPGNHFVVAPYLTASQTSKPVDEVGSRLVDNGVDTEPGVDAKWTPSADTALDATINPDFSQVESDTAQISSNERFALFFPEKRPFFLEGVELFTTPVQAVYTRTITSPKWGARVTGKLGSNAYTALVAEDRGGGSVVLPGPNSSDFADQDFHSTVAIARVRHDLGRSFVSLLGTTREVEGGGNNRVFGPDFQWRPNDVDTVTGQLLLSRSKTPFRPDLAAEWNGQSLAGHAGQLRWSHSTSTIDWYGQYSDNGDEFRADDGFVPQVGYREGYFETGYTLRPTGFFSRLRTFLISDYVDDQHGGTIFRQLSPGFGVDGGHNLFTRVRFAADRVLSGDQVFSRNQLFFYTEVSPSRWLSYVSIDGRIGQDVDFANSRLGDGGSVTLTGTLRPSDHLELQLLGAQRWLDVAAEDGRHGRLFTARIGRVRSVYSFSARAFVRVIGQWVATKRDPSLYLDEETRRDADFSGSVLFAYKLNWQSVLFAGYGDNRTLDDQERLQPAERQVFVKVSYAWQR